MYTDTTDMDHDTSRISPTAHYTGYVWHTRGLAPAELTTSTGRLMHLAMRAPVRAASLAMGGITLDDMLMQRHLIVDALLERAIDDGVEQIVEVAGGLSARGHRFASRHRHITYVEGDLPGMAARKKRLLSKLRGRENHHVVTLNALVDDGPDSLFEAVAPLLDDDKRTAIVTEGLVPYFPLEDTLGMWGRFAKLLSRYPSGVYVSDVYFDDDKSRGHIARGFRRLIKTVARGDNYVHYQTPDALCAGLESAGFERARVHTPTQWQDTLSLPSGPDYVSVLEATMA